MADRVRALKRVDLPAFVYPTRATTGAPARWRASRRVCRVRRTFSISRLTDWMRCRMRRRSVSSFVSPGPRVPMPPPSRDSITPLPVSRGSR